MLGGSKAGSSSAQAGGPGRGDKGGSASSKNGPQSKVTSKPTGSKGGGK